MAWNRRSLGGQESMTDDARYIRRAIDLARQARERGDHPFGALLVANEQIVLEAENTVVSRNNPTHHAEMNLVQAAWGTLAAEVIGRSRSTPARSPAPCVPGLSSGRGYAGWSFLCPPLISEP